MKEKNFLNDLTLIDCFMYAACGMRVIIENGVVTGLVPENEE